MVEQRLQNRKLQVRLLSLLLRLEYDPLSPEIMERIKNIWNVTVDELVNKVTWPNWDDLVQSTIIVLIASLIFAIAIYVIDLGFDNILNLLYKLF